MAKHGLRFNSKSRYHCLGATIHDELGVSVSSSEKVQELLRGIRIHFEKLLGQLQQGDLSKAQLGLAHSYSRSKIKFNVHKADNMIIQAIALLDQLDKDVNTFAMRVKEWYSWHFPELMKIVSDNYKYARLVDVIKNKGNLDESYLGKIEEVVEDEQVARDVLDAAKSSMGEFGALQCSVRLPSIAEASNLIAQCSHLGLRAGSLRVNLIFEGGSAQRAPCSEINRAQVRTCPTSIW